MKERAAKFIAFSIALDESTDINDIAQLAIFIRGVDENLNITEELLDLVPMRDTTTGEDIFECVEEVFTTFNLKWEKLVSVATDGAPSMVGKIKGFIGRLKAKFGTLGLDFTEIHCLLHQENLCAKSVHMTEVLDLVMRIVNLIKANGKTHRQFRKFLEDLHCDYGDLPYLTEVRFLSRGRVLTSFYDILGVIILFLDMQGKSFPELSDPKWVADLAFFADLVEYLNELNLQLQGRDILICHFADKIKAFQIKLDFWQRQLRTVEISNDSLQKVRR